MEMKLRVTNTLVFLEGHKPKCLGNSDLKHLFGRYIEGDIWVEIRYQVKPGSSLSIKLGVFFALKQKKFYNSLLSSLLQTDKH